MNLDLLTATFNAWIQRGVKPKDILHAFHDACLITCLSDKMPKKQYFILMDGLDISLDALRQAYQ